MKVTLPEFKNSRFRASRYAIRTDISNTKRCQIVATICPKISINSCGSSHFRPPYRGLFEFGTGGAADYCACANCRSANRDRHGSPDAGANHHSAPYGNACPVANSCADRHARANPFAHTGVTICWPVRVQPRRAATGGAGIRPRHRSIRSGDSQTSRLLQGFPRTGSGVLR